MAASRWALPLAALVLACGAGHAPSQAEARPAPVLAQRRPAAIGAATADRVKMSWEAAVGGYGRAVAISRTLGRVAFANRDSVALFDLANGKAIATYNICPSVTHTGLAFVGKKLFVVCENGLYARSSERLSALKAPELAPAKVTAAAFSGSRLAVGHHDGVVRIYDLTGGATLEVPVPGPPIDVKSLALSADGTKLAVAWVQGSIWWWNTSAPERFHKLVRHESESDALAFDVKGERLAEEGARKRTTLWQLGEPSKELSRVENGDWVKQILFTPDAQWLVRGGSQGLELSEIGGPKRLALDTRGKVEDVALSDDGSQLAAADREGRLTVWAVR